MTGDFDRFFTASGRPVLRTGVFNETASWWPDTTDVTVSLPHWSLFDTYRQRGTVTSVTGPGSQRGILVAAIPRCNPRSTERSH